MPTQSPMPMHWPMIDRLAPPDREALLARCRRHGHSPDEVLFTEGSPADSLHLVLSGRVTVSVSTPAGDSATLAVLGPGATFGEVALVSEPRQRSATVTAFDRCETLSLSRRDFEQVRRSHPGVDDFLLDLLARQVRRLTEQLTEALYLPVEQRVLRRLVELARTFSGGAAGIRVPITQEALATMAGTSRVTVNQVLQRVRAEGAVTLGRGRITVLDLPALEVAAG
jgi:CRP-like cAMP-binding protein